MAIVSEGGAMPTKLGDQATTPTTKRKNASLGFFSNIFKRKREEPDPAQVVHSAGEEPPSPREAGAVSDDAAPGPEPIVNIEQDLQRLQMSRQDNPFLQRLHSSREELPDEDQTDDSQLVVQDPACNKELALAEIHSHLVRSPPPIAWPRSIKFDFGDIHESARIVEVVPRSNLRPLASKERDEVMDQCLQDILQTQRSLPLQKASTVDETFTGRLSPCRSPPKAPPSVRCLSPRRGRTPPDRVLMTQPAAPESAAPDARLGTPLAPLRPPRRSVHGESRLGFHSSSASFQRSGDAFTRRPNT
ncbi:uncharacterized protein LOC119112299 isoform X4 [Pollicipes pollicipes]|uniref:uncharacterized protein LOC119112299 isoform X4 n=2 Tax=Pollicipes pollicipes TaxID=41117 RepID=UPI00188538F3|nr:uncharacterized protein LOC119112299 isoform X4 [Pollicipes pollicipes]